jgi:hypothetical protein
VTTSQTMSRVGESVVVTETRVRTPLGPPLTEASISGFRAEMNDDARAPENQEMPR